MKSDEIIARIHKVYWAQEAGRPFPCAVCCRPKDLESLPIAEQIGGAFLSQTEINFKLIVAKADVLGKDNDHIFKRQLSFSQPIHGRE